MSEQERDELLDTTESLHHDEWQRAERAERERDELREAVERLDLRGSHGYDPLSAEQAEDIEALYRILDRQAQIDPED